MAASVSQGYTKMLSPTGLKWPSIYPASSDLFTRTTQAPNPTLGPVKAMAGFFVLPREIRDMVYRHYVAVEGGYVCETEDFVAEEMHGLALRTNPIKFSTLSGNDDLGRLARKFHSLIESLNRFRLDMSKSMLGKYTTQEAYGRLKALYPQYTPLLDALRAATPLLPMREVRGTYGEAPSVFRHFVRDVLQIIHSCNPRAIDRMMEAWLVTRRDPGQMHILSVLHCPIEPWIVPAPYDLRQLDFIAHGYSNESLRGDYWKWRFSAASAAIFFLQCLPDTVRTHVRRLIVEEDQVAVAFPESHGRGFIPFCRENPLLRVERRVNIWRNVFQSHYPFYLPAQHQYMRNLGNETPLDSATITCSVSSWITEARALIPSGMPESSYLLVLDGNPVPQLCTRIFQSIVQRDVAWQSAWTECWKQGRIADASWFEARALDSIFGHPQKTAM
ncbi:hypothetical protein CSUB01_10601 [Colletotrichum sublineola]|uniref:Uncharacterized protein n=1 Tax=Colletotrichum sublineola TaxID=1173701 RepID=A0A066XLQ0_COLSU|nr:hypothetical protein CSUB01_10601 [Colletotrichum sublineola]